MDIHREHDDLLRREWAARGSRGAVAVASTARVARREPWRLRRAALRWAAAASHLLSASLVAALFLASVPVA